MILIILEFSRALGETADGPAELVDHEGVRVIAPIRPHLRARPEECFVDGAPAFLDRPAPERRPGPQLVLRRRRSAVGFVNHSRSPKPALRIAVHLSARTPPHEIAALREAVFAYVDEHPKAWRYASIVHIDGFELGEGWVRLAMWLTSASPGGFHDWKTLYQDRHRFYMWLHTYLDEAKLHYCSPTVPLLQIKNNAEAIYKKQQ